jgi:hypothetical protein
VTGLAVVAALAADAQPGDALYGVKRGTEQTQLALAGDARGRTLLGFASARIEELSVVLSEETSADLVADTLATMDAQTVDGAAWLAGRAADSSSSAPLDELAGWSAGQSAILADLDPTLPAAARDDAAASADLLARIDERVEALRVALACPAGPATEGADDLGPRPVPCPPTPAPVDEDPEPPRAGLSGTGATPTTAAPGEEATGSGTSPGSSGTGGPTGSADPSGSPGAPTSGPGSDSGGLPEVVPSAPGSPAPQSLPLPVPGTPGQPLPDVDPTTPDPEVASRPPSGTAGGSSAGSSPAGSSSPGSTPAESTTAGSSSAEESAATGGAIEPGVCPPVPLPVMGDC